ncbi:MAG: UDP-glucose 4-epimerase, partial [Thermoleophilales bacterium]|nr:UDP-glucose 4-epimerase [Thermoleophilales bacterium]
MSRVLVTGGAGFIGSTVVDQLRAAGHEPVIFDVRPSPHHARGEVETVIGDVRRFEDLRRAADGCDAIVHMAAAADVNDVAER